MSLDYFDCKHYLHTHFPEYPICDDNLANALTHIPIRPMSSFLLTGLPSQTGRQLAEAISRLRYDLIKQHAHSASNELSTKVKTISPHSPYTVTDDISTFCKSHPYGTIVIDFDNLAYTQNTGEILSGFLIRLLKKRSCAGISLSHNYFIILANQNIKLITLPLRVHTDFTFTFSKPTKLKHHQGTRHISSKPSNNDYMYLVYKLIKPSNPSVPKTKVYICKTKSLRTAERIRVALQGDPGCRNKYFEDNPSIDGSYNYTDEDDQKGLLRYGYDYISNRTTPFVNNPEPFIARYSKKFIKHAKDYKRLVKDGYIMP